MTKQDFENFLREVSFVLAQSKTDFLLLGGKDLEGRMKQRIFNKGLDSNDRLIGKYKSKQWIKTRQQKGRTVQNVDLEFSGNLRNSIQTVKDGNEVVISVINDLDYLKATGQEIIQGKKKGKDKLIIFEPTPKEEKGVQNYIGDLIDEKIESILAKYK